MVDPEVDGDILATVYRRLVQRYQSGLEGASARQRLQAVERAYEVLGDPHRRFRYDAELSDAAERDGWMEPELSAIRDVPKPPAVVPVMTQLVPMAERGGTRQPTTVTQAASRQTSVTQAAPRPTAAPQPTAATQAAPVTRYGPATRTVPVSVLDFGRYAGWSLRQLAAHDRDYLEWLLRSPGGRQYHAEITALLPQR